MPNILLSSTITEQVESLLKNLEGTEGVLSNSSILILGHSVLFSRYGNHDTRMILHLVRGKPLSKIDTRYVPVYHQGAWRNLYLIKLGNFTLGLSTLVDRPFSGIVKGIEDFRLAFMASRLEIPSEVCSDYSKITRNRCCFYEVLQIGMYSYFFIKI
jgi:hypothetical protein